MRWIDRLREFGSAFRMSGRAAQTFSTGPVSILDAIATAGDGSALRVSRAQALSVPAVLRGRNMICSVATLPLVQFGPDNRPVDNPLFTQLDGDVANLVTLAQTLEDLIFDAIAWWRVTARDFAGYPASVRRLDPDTVSVNPPDGRSPAPLPSGVDPRDGIVYVDGQPVGGRDIIRFDSPNPAVLAAGARSIRRALMIDKTAAMYSDNPRPLDYFSPDPDADEITDDEAQQVLSTWAAARRKRSTAWVPKALKYNTVTTPSPSELQLAELTKQVGLDIANMLGVDPEDLGISTTSRTYSNDVDRRQHRVNEVLSPYMQAITGRLSMGDVTKRGYRVAFDLRDYLKANPTERASVQKTYLDMGVLTPEEIRDQEGYGPMPANSAPAPDPAVVDEQVADGVAAAAAAGWTFDRQALHLVDLPMQSFAVDSKTRTIVGMAMPYGVVGVKNGLKFEFAKGALQWSDVGRVKMLRDHAVASPLGRAVKLTNTPTGLAVEFKVARGTAGDEALALAEDGVLDGLSAGVDFDMAVDAVPHPRKPGVLLVRRADLREVSLTPMPVYDDARVTSVAASLTGGNAMPCTTCGQVHAEGVACQPSTPAPAPAGVTLSNDQFAALVGRLNAPPAPQADPGPTPVNPTGRLTASVTDPAPYTFDRKGNLRPGAFEFSADLISGLRDGDSAAYGRAMDFVRAQFDVVTTDVNELNPTRNRQDMYVDQRDFRYPIWDAINKGTLTDITPFAFPKFSSASGLVGAHTEGTEPSSGTLVTTSQTVTPTAVSGKAKISRETWDQGGNPQIGNLIWRQMLKGWYEALEAAAVAVLDAASPTQIDFSGTPGLANDDLDQAITAALASLQFVRGGFSMDKAFSQIDLYKALVAAVDGNGRRLYPALGPSNAMGSVSNRFAALDVNGVEFLPAWALAATGTVAASSYLFDSGSVHGWASTPQRLTIDQTEVANVYIGIWGYKATAISDINGVREIVYDPS